MKGWFYTGRIFEEEEINYLHFPIGRNKGFVGIEQEGGEYETFDVAILPDGTLAEIEEREYQIVMEESPK